MAVIRVNRKIIVIDCGSTSEGIASNALKNFLKAKAINKIDILAITHFHSDHINDVDNIAKDITIDKVIYAIPKGEYSKEYTEFVRFIKENNISSLIVEQQDSITFSNISIDVLSPPKDSKIKDLDEVNANSLILLVSVKNNNYLFMGDATKESEISFLKELEKLASYDMDKQNKIQKKLMGLTAIQIGHHGSKTSTSDTLLKNISAKYAIISAKKQKYGHPNKETLDILEKYNINTQVTEINGAIKF